MQSPSRRALLTVGTMAVAGLLAACSSSGGSDGSGHGAHKADPDLPIRARAAAAGEALLGQYDALLAGAGATDGRLKPLRAELVQQQAALAVGLPTAAASSHSAQPSPGVTGAVPVPPAVPTAAALATAERTTAQARLADLDAASPALARLLASVAAAGALHALLLGDPTPLAVPAPAAAPATAASRSASASASSPAPSSRAATAPTTAPSASSAPLPTSAVTALQAALAAEHAAVYGYGVIGARTPAGPKRDDARAVYAAHQARRDAWHRILGAGGATPAAAAPGYQLPFAVPDAAAAVKLAGYLETRLTAVYGDLVAGTTGELRGAAATALRECVLQANHWGAPSSALPGMPAPTTDGASATVSGSAKPTS